MNNIIQEISHWNHRSMRAARGSTLSKSPLRPYFFTSTSWRPPTTCPSNRVTYHLIRPAARKPLRRARKRHRRLIITIQRVFKRRLECYWSKSIPLDHCPVIYFEFSISIPRTSTSSLCAFPPIEHRPHKPKDCEHSRV